MYGRQGKLISRPGQRDALAAILLGSMDALSMPGCRLYLVGASHDDSDGVLVTELWDSEDAHKGSLALAAVRETITRAMPLIERVEGEAMTLLHGWPTATGGER